MSEDHRQLIRDFVRAQVHGTPEDDEDLFQGGYANSLFAVQLVLWVEQTFDLRVDGHDLAFTHFSSVDAIAAFVAHKHNRAGGAAWTST